MSLSSYQKLAYKYFGERAKEAAKKNVTLELTMEKAQIKYRSEVYYSVIWLTSILVAIIGVIIACVLFFIIFPALASPPSEIAFFSNKALTGMIAFIIPVMLPPLVYVMMMSSPKSKMAERAKSIDKNLSYASNYMAALASANVPPATIFRGLARQEIYGEIMNEAGMIARDIDIFGKDLMKVLHKAMERSPSVKFQDFLQGIITTSTSGGSLKSYFVAKSDQYTKENRVEQKATLETLGVMAESFVTVVVAMPLFLIIMMGVMAMMGGAGGTDFLYIIVGLMIPLSQFMFIVILSGIKVE